MTVIEFLITICVIASVVLQCVTLLIVQNAMHTFLMRESARRRWVRQEHDE